MTENIHKKLFTDTLKPLVEDVDGLNQLCRKEQIDVASIQPQMVGIINTLDQLVKKNQEIINLYHGATLTHRDDLGLEEAYGAIWNLSIGINEFTRMIQLQRNTLNSDQFKKLSKEGQDQLTNSYASQALGYIRLLSMQLSALATSFVGTLATLCDVKVEELQTWLPNDNVMQTIIRLFSVRSEFEKEVNKDKKNKMEGEKHENESR